MNLLNALEHVNWLSVIVAAISAFLVGGVWYGPLFGKAWMHEFGFTESQLKGRRMLNVFSLSILLSLIAALTLELFIGRFATPLTGVIAGLLVGFGWIASMIGILYLFEMRSIKAYLINAGYCVISITLMGLILGAWQ